MIQLWLANRRIDSIEKLREAFAARDDGERRALCAELLEKMDADILIPWLDRCGETRPQDSACERERAKAIGGGTLEDCRLRLGDEKDAFRLSSAGVAALAKICATDEQTVRGALEQKQRLARRSGGRFEELRKRIERQGWYLNDTSVRRMFAGIRWEQVAVNSTTLAAVLARKAERADDGKADVYLCNVGEAFTLRAPARLRNLRLVGFGEPNVQFSPLARGEELDMAERNLKFERFRLNCQGVALRHGKTNCCDVTII